MLKNFKGSVTNNSHSHLSPTPLVPPLWSLSTPFGPFQALKSDEALLSCMTYVDLNPVRAGMADTPEASSHISLREQLEPEFDVQQAIDDETGCGDLLDFRTSLKPLLPFENRLLNEPQTGILFNFDQYLALVDWTGRTIRSDKRGHIDSALPLILNRLQITKF